MNFINRYVLLFAFISFIASVSFILILNKLLEDSEYIGVIVISIIYAIIYFASGLLIGRRDIFEGYLGFNYHLVTFISCNSVPLVFAYLGLIPDYYIDYTMLGMLFWGFGLAIHFTMFLIGSKRSIKGFDKSEVFD